MEKWFQDQKITYEGLRILSVNGVSSIQSTTDLAIDDVVCVIPKSAILSPRNSVIGKKLRKHCIFGGLALTVTFLYEQARGSKSQWFEYVQSLPLYEPLPIFWQHLGYHEAIACLSGTSIALGLAEEFNLLKEDYDEVKHFFEFTFEQFCMASSIVSSRCFEVDSFHGDALVPFADLFNHKTDGEHVHLESEDDEQNIELRVFRSCLARTEVYNTYGQRDNAFILKKYGFTEINNPYDDVQFDFEQISILLDIQSSYGYVDDDISQFSSEEQELLISYDGSLSPELSELIQDIASSNDRWQSEYEVLDELVQRRLESYLTDQQVRSLQASDHSKYALILRQAEIDILRRALVVVRYEHPQH